MTATALPAVPVAAHLIAASKLQELLPEVVALGLDARQAHWNVIGPAFLPLHALTDELAADSASWADRIAERAVALGSPVDARLATVGASVSKLPAGWLSDYEVIFELTSRLGEVATSARDALDVLEESDAVGHDIVVEVLEGLEKFRWMLQAHTR